MITGLIGAATIGITCGYLSAKGILSEIVGFGLSAVIGGLCACLCGWFNLP